MDGIIVVNKPKDYTSRDIVNIVGKKLNTKKIGHTGTLDPLATGVLVLCVGKATKLVEILTSNDKEYVAEVMLGVKTDTLDVMGTKIEEKDVIIEKEVIENVLKEMIGSYEQEVPIYSAVKINGKKLYEYARNNEEVILPKHLVNIKDLKLISDIKYENNKTIFSIYCKVSKGTYIRSLINDFALKLNTIGIMTNLQRTKQGIFSIEDSYTLDQINNDNFKMISIENAINDCEKIVVDENLEFKIKNGVKVPNIYNQDKVLFLNSIGKAIALYKVSSKDTEVLEVLKMF